VDGTTAVVGALLHPFSPPEKPGPGAAYVFVQSGKIWSQQAELTASDAVAGDEFGGSVAVIGGTIVAGAPEHRVGLNQQGAGYVYVPGPTTVTFSPNSVNFGNQAVNTTSKAQSVALTNLGTSTLDISSIAITLGPSFTTSSNTCGATLAVNKTCKVSVTFTPTQLDSETGSLSFADTAAPSPQMVWLKGTGIPQTKLTPARYTFPKTEVGFTSAAHNFTLKNNQPITLTGISYSTSTPFAVSASTCGATLNANKSCTISVTFSPTQTGEAYGPLTVSDSANNSPQKVNLSGTGD